ncbi:hypothetical protein SprV_0902713300 [Sparganum proliferum]
MELWDVVVIAAALFSPNSNEGENGHTYAVGQLEQRSSNEIAENIDGIFNPVISNRIAVIESAYPHGVANGHNSPAEQVKQSRSKETDENIDEIFSPVLANRIAATKVAKSAVSEEDSHNTIIRIRQLKPSKPVQNASKIINFGSANKTSEIGIGTLPGLFLILQ